MRVLQMLDEDRSPETLDSEESPENLPSPSLEENQNSSPTPPQSPSTDIRLEFDNLTRQTINEQNTEIVRLQRELAAKNATPVTQPTDDPAAFLSAPRTAIRDEINTAVKEQVAPLIEFTKKLERDGAYTKLVNSMKLRAPQLYAAYEKYSDYIDSMMSTLEPTPQNLSACITSAAGAVALGFAGPQPNLSQPANPTPPVIQPPNLPPSSPPAPRKATTVDTLDAKVAALTESQRKAAKLQGFTDLKQYVQYMDAPPEVDSWKDIK